MLELFEAENWDALEREFGLTRDCVDPAIASLIKDFQKLLAGLLATTMVPIDIDGDVIPDIVAPRSVDGRSRHPVPCRSRSIRLHEPLEEPPEHHSRESPKADKRVRLRM